MASIDGVVGEELQCSVDVICCLIEGGVRCTEAAGFTPCSNNLEMEISEKKLKLEIDNTEEHIYICDYHMTVIKYAGKRQAPKRQTRKGSKAGPSKRKDPELDLSVLPYSTLQRYASHFNVSTPPSIGKKNLAKTCTEHLKSIKINEKDVVTYFIYMIKNNASSLDVAQTQSSEDSE